MIGNKTGFIYFNRKTKILDEINYMLVYLLELLKC